MNWVTTIWAMAAAVSLTLGSIHAVVWFRHPKVWINLLVCILAIAVAFSCGFDLLLMRERNWENLASLYRWMHVPQAVSLAALAGFTHLYFRQSRVWPLRLVIAMQLMIPALCFGAAASGSTEARFLGEPILKPVMTGGWQMLGEEIPLLLATAFSADAAVRLWRRGGIDDIRRAVVVGGGVVACLLLMIGMMLVAGVPYGGSLGFAWIVGIIAFESSRDVVRTSQLSHELQKSSESTSLAAAAAGLALWRWEIGTGRIWVSPSGRQLYGIPETGGVDRERFFETLHPDDREPTRQAAMQAFAGDGMFSAEYRVALPGCPIRWIGARGEVEFAQGGQPVCIRGVSMDISERKNAEAESARHRTELAHLSRVSTLSELSGSLAHELNQPLAIILSNAQAAQRMLDQTSPDMEEVGEILTDIIREDRRAGEVIKRLRVLMKRGETETIPLSLNEVVAEVIQLTNADLIGRGVTVIRNLSDGLPSVLGDRVQLQQVILNLILNGADAMAGNASGSRYLHISTARSDRHLRFSVRDSGHGLTVDAEKLFAPFYTTKPHGLGMGLAICRSIAIAHHGSLTASSPVEGGAVFVLELPVEAAGVSWNESGSDWLNPACQMP